MNRSIHALVIVAAAFLASVAAAHPKLVQTSPQADAMVASPARIELHFSERLMNNFSGADLFMVDMPGMKMDKPSQEAASAAIGADGTTLIITPAKPLAAGSYRVDYHAVSADTHKVTGTFSFSVK